MPDWTSNTIRVEGDETDIAAFLDAVKWQDQIFDFNRIIAMPETLKHTASGRRTIDGEEVTSWYIVNPEDQFLGEVRLFTADEEAALRDIGHRDWHSWSVANWGTKWNACRAEITEACLNHSYLEIRFATAWSAPVPVFHRMFEMFPNLSFTCTCQHEGDSCRYSIERPAEAA